MSPSTIALITLTLVTCAGLLIGDWRRRAGRGSPLTRVRTAVRRRAGRKVSDVEGRQLLAAGFAAQVIGPLLARSTAAARRADAAKTRLERKLDGEHRERAELQNLVARLGDAYDGVRPTNPRWHRYCFYGLVMVVDIGTGLVIAKGVNLAGGEALGFGASAGMFLFFLGKLGGTGLRRLDLGPVRGSKVHSDSATSSHAPALLHPDIGKPWVSTAMIVVSVVGMVVFIAGMTASRMVAQGITDAALAATQQAQGTSGVVLPKVPWWQSGLSSAVALGSFAATAFLALRNHPVTRRIEELELRIMRRTREATKAVRPLGSAAEASSRHLALLDAAVAELAARLDLDADLSEVAPFRQVCTAVGELHGRQAAFVAAFDAASEPRGKVSPEDEGNAATDAGLVEVAAGGGGPGAVDHAARTLVLPPAPDVVGQAAGSAASNNGGRPMRAPSALNAVHGARFGRPGAGPGWWRWLIPFGAAVLLLAPGPIRDVREAQRRRAWEHDPATPWILSDPVGPRRTAPVDLAVLVDESGSTSESDPGGARWVQADQLLRWMGRNAAGDRITIGTFASTARALAPLVPAAVAKLPDRIPIPGSTTRFVPAVDRIDAALGSSDPARQRVAVLVTDGSGGDVELALERLDPSVRLYVFGLDDDGTWSDVRDRWGDRVTGTAISGDAGSIASAQAALLSALTGQTVSAKQQAYREGAAS